MTQTLLWDCPARAKDPITSRLAAQEITADGSRERHRRIVLEALSRAEGPVTAKELASLIERDETFGEATFDKIYSIVWRRLSDLKRLGKVDTGPARICSETEIREGKQRMLQTWRPL